MNFKKILLLFLGVIMAKSLESKLKLSSPDLLDGQKISIIFTCDEKFNHVPTLKWSHVPHGTKSFAIIVDDPDAQAVAGKTWVHWVIYNIPVKPNQDEYILKVEDKHRRENKWKDGTMQGINDSKEIGYDGPCPPAGNPHRYYFKLYALNTKLDLKSGASKKELTKAMDGHILDHTHIIGTYQRK